MRYNSVTGVRPRQARGGYLPLVVHSIRQIIVKIRNRFIQCGHLSKRKKEVQGSPFPEFYFEPQTPKSPEL